jgi:hypothetical protein
MANAGSKSVRRRDPKTPYWPLGELEMVEQVGLARFWGIHPNSVVAIVGSGPSAVRVQPVADVVIAVNGAARLRNDFDYFLCGDRYSFRRDWFEFSCSRVRLIATLVASLDYQLYPQSRFPTLLRLALPVERQHELCLPVPVWPHGVFEYRSFREELVTRRPQYLLYRGTIACCAVQLAFAFGSREIVLFGCEFDHSHGHYFYNSVNVGSIVSSQRRVMERCLALVRAAGVCVTIFGPTSLAQYDRLL